MNFIITRMKIPTFRPTNRDTLQKAQKKAYHRIRFNARPMIRLSLLFNANLIRKRNYGKQKYALPFYMLHLPLYRPK